MDEWELEVTLSNATGLKKVSTLEQNPYCSVWYTQGDNQRTSTHKKGGTNPTWNKVIQLPINHNQLEQLHGSVMVEIFHESRGRDSKIGTAIIPLTDMKNGEGIVEMHNVDPVGKVGVALMRKKKEPVTLTSGGRGVGSLKQSSSTSKSRFGIRKGFAEIVKIANGISSLTTTTDNLMKLGGSMNIGGHRQKQGKDIGKGGEEHERGDGDEHEGDGEEYKEGDGYGGDEGVDGEYDGYD